MFAKRLPIQAAKLTLDSRKVYTIFQSRPKVNKSFTIIFVPTLYEVKPFIKTFGIIEKIKDDSLIIYIARHGDSLIVVSGTGATNIKRAFERVKARYAIKEVFLTGIAGALNEELNVGDLFIPKNIRRAFYKNFGWKLDLEYLSQKESQNDLVFDCDKLSKIIKVNSSSGDMVTADRFVEEKGKKGELNKIASAIAVDMEGFELGRLCQSNNIPFKCLKVISDDSMEDIDKDLSILFNRMGGIEFMGIVKYLIKGPSKIRYFIKIFRNSRKIYRSLFQLASFMKDAC